MTEQARTPPVRTHARVALLALNAWLVVLALPVLHVGAASGSLLLAAAPLGLVAIGLWARSVAAARALLLGGFPPALALAVAFYPELVERDAYGPFGMGVAALSLVGYVAAAAHATGGALAILPHEEHPASPKEPVAEPPARRWLRRFLLGAGTIGALAIAVVAPAAGRHRELVERWGEAAPDAAVLAAVVAGLLAAVALGGVIGPALRAERSARPPAARRRVLAVALFVATVAGMAWLLLAYFDAQARAMPLSL